MWVSRHAQVPTRVPSIKLRSVACRFSSTIIRDTATEGADIKIKEGRSPKIALVMGVANHRSIAWACVEAFHKQGYHVLVTYQNEKHRPQIEKLIASSLLQSSKNTEEGSPRITAMPCNVETDIPRLFQEQIPTVLLSKKDPSTPVLPLLDTIVHSIAYAPFDTPNDTPKLVLSEASLQDFQVALHVSAYSLLETAKYAKSMMNSSLLNTTASITALTYLGSIRAVSNYYLMGPAKAALEATVRGLALELGHFSSSCNNNNSNNNHDHCIRVNAVSAGPLRTLSSRGIPNFTGLWQHSQETSSLKRNVTAQEVANTVRFLASQDASGITGQVVYVDAGYSTIVPHG
jgi:enoyl-[acyl-carrier protein] reductase I